MKNSSWLQTYQKIFTPFVWKLLIILFFTEFVKGALLVSILPIYMESTLGLSAFMIGWAFALQYIGDNLFRTPIGWLLDMIGYRLSMLIGLGLTLGAVSLLAISESVFWIIIACGLLGIGTSPLWPCVITGSTEVAGKSGRGTVMSTVYVAWLSGVGLGPVFINFFIKDSHVLAFQILIIMMVAVTLVAVMLPRVGTGEHGKTSDALESSGRRKLELRMLNWVRIKQYFQEVKDSVQVSKLFFPAMFLQTFSIGLLTPVVTLYVRKVLQLSGVQFSMLLVFGGAFTVLFMIPVGRLVDRFGTRWFLHIGFALSSSMLIMLTMVRSLLLVYGIVALVGLAYAMIIPAWNALIADAVPEEKRGAVWGFYLTIEGLGMIIGPVVSGKMWDELGPASPFITSGIVVLILFFVHIFISNRNKIMVR